MVFIIHKIISFSFAFMLYFILFGLFLFQFYCLYIHQPFCIYDVFIVIYCMLSYIEFCIEAIL